MVDTVDGVQESLHAIHIVHGNSDRRLDIFCQPVECMLSVHLRKRRHISNWQTDIQLLKWTEIEVRKMKIVGRSDDISPIRSKRGDGVGCAIETRGEHDEIELRGIACDAHQSVGQVIHRERPMRVRCIVAGSAEFRYFVTEVEEQCHQLRSVFRAEAMIEFHFRIEARRSLTTPVRFFGKEPSVPVIIEFPVTERKKEQEVPPTSFMKDEHLGLRVPLGDRFRFCESLLICSAGIAAGIMIEVATIAVDDAYD